MNASSLFSFRSQHLYVGARNLWPDTRFEYQYIVYNQKIRIKVSEDLGSTKRHLRVIPNTRMLNYSPYSCVLMFSFSLFFALSLRKTYTITVVVTK